MSIEQRIPQNAGNDWINSLERAVEICRDQISFARAMKVEKIAVPADSLEKILDALPAATPTTSAAAEREQFLAHIDKCDLEAKQEEAALEAAKEIAQFAKELAETDLKYGFYDEQYTAERVAAIITKHLGGQPHAK